MFSTIIFSCEDTGFKKQKGQYPGEMMYFPEDNLKCRSIDPVRADCWDIKPNKNLEPVFRKEICLSINIEKVVNLEL